MAWQEKIVRIDAFQEQITAQGPLSPELLNRINYKFRLDWNYYSNKMEGNSLTMQETRTVMVGNITIGGKPLHDVMEMRRHDEVITQIIQIGKGELNISEKRIREIHKAIMYEEDPAKIKLLGQWKTDVNFLTNYRGERFDFVPPADVAERMHALINFLNVEREKIGRGDAKALHPVALAFRFHLEYVSIHPFYDGNGRTSRILMNLILIAYGYPPIYVKTEEREAYYTYLADVQAYGGPPDLLDDFMAGLLIRSQELILQAIAGKPIEEPEDIDKRLLLLEKELAVTGSENDIVLHLNKEVFIEIYESWLKKLLHEAIVMAQKFNHLFKGNYHMINLQSVGGQSFGEETPEWVLDSFEKLMKTYPDRLNSSQLQLNFHASYGTFIKGGVNSFGCNYGFTIDFSRIAYEIKVDLFTDANGPRPQRSWPPQLLHKPMDPEQMDEVVTAFGETILSHIDFHTKKLGLR